MTDNPASFLVDMDPTCPACARIMAWRDAHPELTKTYELRGAKRHQVLVSPAIGSTRRRHPHITQDT